MKRILAQLILTLLFSMSTFAVFAQEVKGEARPAFSFQEALEKLNLEEMEEYRQKIDGELGRYLTNRPVSQWFIDFIKGDWKVNGGEMGHYLLQRFMGEFLANTSLLGKLLLLCVLAALLVNLQTSFAAGVGRISYWVCFLALAALALGSFRVVIEVGHETIDNMSGFMMAMLPQMLLLTAGLGNVNSSVMLFPVLMSAATAFADAIKNIVFPLIIMSAVLSIVNHLSDGLKVERMARFFRQAAQITLGFFLTLFAGILTLRSVYASVLDKVTLRSAKFVTDNAIPVVGKIFSDTVEVAAGYVVMLKQVLGIFGVMVIICLILLPLLKIAAIGLIYRFSSMLAEPLGDGKTAAILESMSTHLFLMLAAVAAVGLMFLIMIAIIAGMSNGFAMLR